jgi:hypothetical protein
MRLDAFATVRYGVGSRRSGFGAELNGADVLRVEASRRDFGIAKYKNHDCIIDISVNVRFGRLMPDVLYCPPQHPPQVHLNKLVKCYSQITLAKIQLPSLCF